MNAQSVFELYMSSLSEIDANLSLFCFVLFCLSTVSLNFFSFSCLLQLSSCHAVLSTQLADAMMFPITQFKERDLKGRVLKQIQFLSTAAITKM